MPFPVVLVGHAHSCPLHGMGHVVSGAESGQVRAAQVACVGDSISCGAKIITGSPGASIQGRPIARKGDRSDHGGTLEEGADCWMVP